MANAEDTETLDSIVNSLAKMIIALNHGHELTAEQIELLKQAAMADTTWNPLKQNDLVPVADIIALGEEGGDLTLALQGKIAGLISWDKTLSNGERSLIQELDDKLKKIAKQLLAKAKKGTAPEDIPLKGNSPWAKLARKLLKEAMQMLSEQKGS